MNEFNEPILSVTLNCSDEDFGQQEVIRKLVFPDEEKQSLNQQSEVYQSDTSVARQQQYLPENDIYTNSRRTEASSNTYNIILKDNVMQNKVLKNKLSEAYAKNHKLTAENRLLKMQGKRYEHALSVHEGMHDKLPQINKLHEEDIRTLKNQIHQTNTRFTEMDRIYKSQANELLILRKQYAHLLSLPKKEDHSKINELNNRLKETLNTIDNQHDEILKLKRRIENIDFCENNKYVEYKFKHPSIRRRKASPQIFRSITRCIAKPKFCEPNQTDRPAKKSKVTSNSQPTRKIKFDSNKYCLKLSKY